MDALGASKARMCIGACEFFVGAAPGRVHIAVSEIFYLANYVVATSIQLQPKTLLLNIATDSVTVV